MLSKIATSDGHGEKSPYFDGWKAYENDPCHVTENRDGVIRMGLAENQLCFDLVQDGLKNNPQASICSAESPYEFSDIAIFQDYHDLPEFRNTVANFMGRVRGNRVTFNPDRIAMSGGATGTHETVAFCLADPGDAFLLPTPYYPGANMEHFETKQVSKQEPSLIMPLLKRKKEEDDDDVVVSTELSLGLNYEPTAEKIKKPRIDDQKDKFLKANGSVLTELELYRDLWKIKKTLTKSDLGDQSRLLIYKGYVETHVLPSMADEVKQVLHSQDGLRVGVWDYDTHSLHQLDFKHWPSSKSYVLTLNWNKDFVKRRNLKEKDQIALFWDGRTSTFWFRVFHHI